MALADKNIVITPNISAASDPKIVFSGADASTAAQNITLTAYPTLNGMLSFDGSAGQLLSVTNRLTGTIFAANDVSGIPSIEVLDTGLVKLAQYGGNVLIGTGTDDGTNRLQVTGNATINNNLNVGGTFSLNSVPVYQEQIVAITGASTTIDVDFNLAANKYNTFYITLYNANSATINFKNLNTVSSTNKMFSFNIILKNSATALANTSSITWQFAAATTMLSTVSWAGGSTARPPSTVTASAVDIWSFFTFDGGATLFGSLAMKDAKSA